jgi:trehalose 6-phosphate phosphatase
MIEQQAAKPGTVDEVTAIGAGRLEASPLAILLDVDGTLAPIAPTPGDARVPDATRRIVAQLARAPGVVVALVSGRAAEDTWRLAGVDGAWVIGNHGIELRAPDGSTAATEEVRRFEPAIRAAAGELRELEHSVKGVIVENKRWTISLHYRMADAAAIPGVIERGRGIAERQGLRTRDAKMTLELRPPIEIHKGTASVSLGHRLGARAWFYAGDDATDEDAFAALRAENAAAMTIRILGPDDATRVATKAEFVLGAPQDLWRVLEWLAARRRRTPA